MTIQQLVAAGRLEEALNQLKHDDAIMLQSRHSNGKKQYGMGLINFDEWQRIQNQISFAILELASLTIQVVQTTNIVTINFTSAKTFAESLERFKLNDLVKRITEEFKGKPAMEAWLPLKQEYDSFELLGKPFEPGYLVELKKELIAIYDEFWTAAKNKNQSKIRSAVEAIYGSLTKGKDEKLIRECITDFQVFFYENPGYVGLKQMEEFEALLGGGKMRLFKEKRPESYNEELQKIHAELVAISNRILQNIEG